MLRGTPLTDIPALALTLIILPHPGFQTEGKFGKERGAVRNLIASPAPSWTNFIKPRKARLFKSRPHGHPARGGASSAADAMSAGAAGADGGAAGADGGEAFGDDASNGESARRRTVASSS